MEKLTWVKPEMEEVRFAANEYIASCGESGSSYKFVCNAAAGVLYWFLNHWQDWGEKGFHLKVGQEYSANDAPSSLSDYTPHKIGLLGGGYEPCKKTHDASTTSDFYWGFVDYNNNSNYDEGEAVIVHTEGWIDDLGADFVPKDYHATTNLNMSSWGTTKS